MDAVTEAHVIAGRGVDGSADRSRRRQITIIEREEWERLMRELGATIDPSRRRANLMVSGIRLAETRGRVLLIGNVRVSIAGEVKPCERMDEALPGLRAAMYPNWAGGAFAQVLDDGTIHGDEVRWEAS
jgi:MOSC domain-containing protein YiiM